MGGAVSFIGGFLATHPTGRGEAGHPRSDSTSRRSRDRARCATLRYFSRRPAEGRAELGALDPIELGAEHEPLVAAQLSGEIADAEQLESEQHERLHLRPWVGDLILHCLEQAAADRMLELRVSDAATLDRPPSVIDPRDESLLEHACEMRLARKGETLPCSYDELKRRLTEAVLEILRAQAVTMHVEQQLPSRGENERDALGGVLAKPASG